MKRVLVKCSHLDNLTKELVICGIMVEENQKVSDHWTSQIDLSRIFNHDETPQFVSYGVNGSPSRLLYGGRGERCQKMFRHNRECVTINPMLSLSDTFTLLNILFR
nr:uncharacterized protein LOC105843975 [Hydra vulgaris]XP_047127538.1 uncharacterized protein LOC105843975 [Hydra vulgaris]